MKLKFAHKDINEYVDGPLHFTNDGKVIEVSESAGQIMLEAVHPVNGKNVSIFAKAEDKAKAEDSKKEN